MFFASEIDLLTNSRAGQPVAGEELYRRYFHEDRAVRGLLAREYPNQADREDVLHDAYLSLIRSRSEFRGDASLRTFVYRVVQIAILRRRRMNRTRGEDLTVRLGEPLSPSGTVVEHGETDYSYQRVEAGMLAEKLCSMLPEPLRTAFRLRVVDELSYETISEMTSAPMNTVSTRIFKARKMLMQLLSPGKKVVPGGD